MSDFIDTKKPFSGLSALLYIDAKLVIPIMIITLIGLVTIFSSSSGDLNLVLKQLTRIMIGIITMILIAQVNPDNLKLFAPILYLFTVFLLALVLLFGVGNTADRWLDLYIIRFQPSELMKILVPLMLATFYADKPLPPKVTYILIAILIVLIPVFMIMRQPDLGTALLIGMSGAIAILLAGMSFRFFLAGVFSAASLIPILWLSMHQYQKQRVLTFFNPESDPMGSGYQLMQSKIALGSGGFFGKGFFNGSQSKLGFVPERSTDFIFTAFGEEFGYLGVIILMSMYLFIALRGLSISIKATDNFGRILTGTLSLTIFVYVLVNVGMVIGFLPVVGAPLPFMSYGGTSMVVSLASIGIIMSLNNHKTLIAN